MVFSNKDLILACPYSERTYWRRVKSLRDKQTFVKKTDGDLLTLDDAKLIADQLGFKKEFEAYLNSSNR